MINSNEIKELLYKTYTSKQIKNLRIATDLFIVYYKLLGIEKNYKRITKNSAKLFLEFCPTGNIHEMFYLYNYMLENGYFSIKDFFYYDNDTVLLDGRYIMSGYGNCRQISSLYHDILIEIIKLSNFDINCLKVIGELHHDKLEISEKTNPNHELNLVSQNGEYYIQDPTNYLIFSPRHLLDVKTKFYCHSVIDYESIVIIPESFICSPKIDENEVVYHLQKMNDTRVISKQELLEIEKRIVDKCKNSTKVFDGFYSENIEHIRKVHQKVKRFIDIEE